MNVDRLIERIYLRKEGVDLLGYKAMHQPVFRATKDVFVTPEKAEELQ